MITDDISGTSGNLNIRNSSSNGSLTLSGVNTYTGSTTIDSGATLALSGNGSIAESSALINNGIFDITNTINGATIKTLSGNGTVYTDLNKDLSLSNAAGTFAGVISGDGGLTILAGSETLTGSNSYTGSTRIESGATMVLSGAGSIAGSNDVSNSGTLRVTGVTGNVSLGGSYSQSGGLIMNFSPTSNQQIIINDTATLSGTLSIAAAPGTYNVGRYTLITSNGVSGRFSSFDGSSLLSLSQDYSNYALGYDDKNVYLNLYPSLANTQASISASVTPLRNTFNQANTIINNNLNLDCTVFDKYGICSSVVGSHTNIAGSKSTEMSDGILVISKNLTIISDWADLLTSQLISQISRV